MSLEMNMHPAHGSARSVQRISKFLRVVSDDSMPDERGVMSNDNKLIAIIGYYRPWREYVLYPQPNTVWSNECLSAIKAHLKWMSGLTKYYEPNSKVSDRADNALAPEERTQ